MKHHQYYVYVVSMLMLSLINDICQHQQTVEGLQSTTTTTTMMSSFPFYKNVFCWLRPVVLFFRVASIRRFMGKPWFTLYSYIFLYIERSLVSLSRSSSSYKVLPIRRDSHFIVYT